MRRIAVRAGPGSPEGVDAEPVGSVALRTDGASAPTTYVKRTGGSGNTGWVGEVGWRDMIGQAVAPNAGPTIPTWTQIGATPFYAYKFAVNDNLWFAYHIQHDYAVGTDIYLHTHWLTDGTRTDTVKWEFVYAYAKGHNQANYDLTGTTVTVTQAAQGSAYRHMISEISTGITDATFEVDGVLLVKITRVTNGGTDNADGVFLIVADCHYQANRIFTKNKAPDFYT